MSVLRSVSGGSRFMCWALAPFLILFAVIIGLPCLGYTIKGRPLDSSDEAGDGDMDDMDGMEERE